MWGVYTAAVRCSRASIAELSRGRVPRAEACFKDRAARVLTYSAVRDRRSVWAVLLPQRTTLHGSCTSDADCATYLVQKKDVQKECAPTAQQKEKDEKKEWKPVASSCDAGVSCI